MATKKTPSPDTTTDKAKPAEDAATLADVLAGRLPEAGVARWRAAGLEKEQKTQLLDGLPDKPENITHLRVRALSDGFRRAGRAWPAAGEVVPVGDFTDAEIFSLLTEPRLSVTPLGSAPEDAEK